MEGDYCLEGIKKKQFGARDNMVLLLVYITYCAEVREGGRDGGREGRGGREGGRDGRRDGGTDGRTEGGKEGRREGGKEGGSLYFDDDSICFGAAI